MCISGLRLQVILMDSYNNQKIFSAATPPCPRRALMCMMQETDMSTLWNGISYPPGCSSYLCGETKGVTLEVERRR